MYRFLALAAFAVLGLAAPGAAAEPARLATLQYRPLARAAESGKPLVVVIEENHAQVAVQQEVWRLLEALKAEAGIGVVCVEGLPPDPEHRPISLGKAGLSDVARRATVTAFVEKGWVSGVDAAALLDTGISMYGIENADHYAAHRAALEAGAAVAKKAGEANKAAYAKLIAADRGVFAELNSAWAAAFKLALATRSGDDVSKLLATARAKFLDGDKELVPLKEAYWASTLARRGLPPAPPVTAKELAALKDGGAAFVEALPGRVEWDALATSAGLSALQAKLDAALIARAVEKKLLTDDEATALTAWLVTAPETGKAAAKPQHRRDEAMVANATALAAKTGAKAVVMVIGAMHTPNVSAVLAKAGHPHVVLTPPSLGGVTTVAETEWFKRNSAQKAVPLDNLFKIKPAPAIVREPVRQTYDVSEAVLHLAAELAGGRAADPLAAGGTRVTAKAGAIHEVTVRTESKRDIAFRFPKDGYDPARHGAELVKHWVEVNEALPAMAAQIVNAPTVVAISDTGMMLTRVTATGVETTLLRPYGFKLTKTALTKLDDAVLERLRPLRELPDAVAEKLRPLQDREFGPAAFLKEIAAALDAVEVKQYREILLRSAEDGRAREASSQFLKDFAANPAVVAKRLVKVATDGTDAKVAAGFPGHEYLALLRELVEAVPPGTGPQKVAVRVSGAAQELNLQLVYEILRAGGVPAYQRDLRFYQVADIDRRPEPLKTAYERFAAAPVGGKVRHVFVTTFAEGKEAFEASMYGKHYGEVEGKKYADWKPVEDVLTAAKEATRAANGRGGFAAADGGVIVAKTASQLMADLLTMVGKGGDTANLGLTLVAHFEPGGDFVYLAEEKVPLTDLLLALKKAKDEGKLPKGFTATVIACDVASTKQVERLLGWLDCPYIVAPRKPVRIDLGVTMYRRQVEAMDATTPADEAYIQALRKFIEEDLPKQGAGEKLLELFRLWVAAPRAGSMAAVA